MPSRNLDLHGNAPDHSPVALVLIDVINDLEFPGGEELLPFAMQMAERLGPFKQRCRDSGICAIYVNDNFGRWRSDHTQQVQRCLDPQVRGSQLVQTLRPGPDDYFVLKPKNSAFYATSFEILLQYLQVRTLILTGLTGHNCVLFTAHDAYMRDYRIVVPADCVASPSEAENAHALQQMKSLLKAETTESVHLDLKNLLGEA